MLTDWMWDPSFLPKNGGAMYGWFYWMWMIIMAVELFLLLRYVAPKKNKKLNDRVIFIYGLIMVITEIYKEVFFCIEHGSYHWNLFPWQFCSVPMFVAFIAPLVRNEKIQQSMYRFLSFFGLIAGISTLVLPEGFYWDYITMTCHSFFWHTSITIMGIFLIVTQGYAKSLKNLGREGLSASAVFSVAVIIALALNCIAYPLYFVRHKEYYFNMFYISPYYETSLPLFRDIYPLVPYPVFLLIYLVLFCLGAFVVWFVTFSIRKAFRHPLKA